MNQADQILLQANQANPIKGMLLSTVLDGGRLIATGDKVSELLGLIPGSLYFEKRELTNLASFADFSAKDLVFVESLNVDLLWQLAHFTGAQVALMSESFSEPSLVDLVFKEGDLRSALIQIEKELKSLNALKGQVHLEGSHLNKALLLDRDGVLVEDPGYLNDPSKVVLKAGVVDALKKARSKEYFLIVVSNQSGIGRGLVSWAQYEKVTARMLELFAAEGIYFDRVLRAPFYESSQFASGLVRRSLRKPRPGMIHSIVNEFRLDLSQSIFVGDKASDLMTGAVCGVSQLFLMKSEKTSEEMKAWKEWPLLSRVKASTVREISQLPEIFS